MDRVSSFLQRLVEIIQPLAERLGGPGLTIVAFFDSSFLSLPEVSDALTVLLTAQNPAFWWYYAMMTTLGSVAGCYALYSLGRKGGEAFLRRRMRERHVEWGMALFRRHGMLAIIVPSLLPPPMPFKLFVLIAGIVDVRPLTFVGAVVLGRGFRYGIEAWLAYRYGAQALTFIRENLPAVSIGVAVGLTVFALAIMIWQRRTPQSGP